MSITIRDRKIVATRHFTLQSDIPNPHRDKRCRYGLRGVKSFTAGTVVRATDYEREFEINGETKVEKTTVYDVPRVGWLPDDLARVFSLVDPRVSRDPSTLAEAAVEKGVSIACLCEYAVRKLLADGKIEIGDVIEAYDSAPVE